MTIVTGIFIVGECVEILSMALQRRQWQYYEIMHIYLFLFFFASLGRRLYVCEKD